MPTEIINGPIREGCFVRLRNGEEVGPIKRSGQAPWIWGPYKGCEIWREDGKCADTDHFSDIIEVLPAPVTSPSEPSYEQRLWDDVAKNHWNSKGAFPDWIQRAFDAADLFMAERAKRMKP
jgi:hypothetical protein